MTNYYNKYLKYKSKYLEAKKSVSGGSLLEQLQADVDRVISNEDDFITTVKNETLNLFMSYTHDTDEYKDYLADMKKIKKYNKHSDIELECVVIEEPVNQTGLISLDEKEELQEDNDDIFEISIRDTLNDTTNIVNVNKEMTINEFKEQIFGEEGNAIKILLGSEEMDNNTTIEDNGIGEKANLTAIFIDNMLNVKLRSQSGHYKKDVFINPSDSIYYSVKKALGYKNIPDNLLRLQIRNPQNVSKFIEYSDEETKNITFDDIGELTENITIYFKFYSPSKDIEYEKLEDDIRDWLSDDLNSEDLKELASLTEKRYDDDDELIKEIIELIEAKITEFYYALENKPLYRIHRLACEVFFKKKTGLDFNEEFDNYLNSDDY